jgi:hypothetical protein
MGEVGYEAHYFFGVEKYLDDFFFGDAGVKLFGGTVNGFGVADKGSGGKLIEEIEEKSD